MFHRNMLHNHAQLSFVHAKNAHVDCGPQKSESILISIVYLSQGGNGVLDVVFSEGLRGVEGEGSE